MDGRDAFLTMARDKHYEFSSLRRAQFSTLCMLYELHNQGQDKFVYTCNNCKNHVETRYHCTVCDVSCRRFVFLWEFSEVFRLFRRISISVFHAKRRSVTTTKWSGSDSISTMDHRHPKLVATSQTPKRPASSPSKGAFNRWCTRVSAATQIVVCLRVRR
jgi:hypothetical protein